jgi:hypothetical protein
METSKKASAQRQTEVAIALFRSRHLDCAITLAAAAEGMLPNPDAPFLFAQLRQEPSSSDLDFNLIINWLKHSGAPETAVITEFEATQIIARAITKFIAVYRQSCKNSRHFCDGGKRPVIYRALPRIFQTDPLPSAVDTSHFLRKIHDGTPWLPRWSWVF